MLTSRQKLSSDQDRLGAERPEQPTAPKVHFELPPIPRVVSATALEAILPPDTEASPNATGPTQNAPLHEETTQNSSFSASPTIARAISPIRSITLDTL
jgi:hypothetical protein